MSIYQNMKIQDIPWNLCRAVSQQFYKLSYYSQFT